MYVMGVLHEEGTHVPKSKYMAQNYYQKAAELGQEDAKVSLALIMMGQKGNGVDKNQSIETGNEDTIVRDFNSRNVSRLGSGQNSRIGKPKINVFKYGLAYSQDIYAIFYTHL